MSLIYCKSEQYLEDADGNAILENTGSLPYYFNNQFKAPIKIAPNNKIELVSADLNLDNINRISSSDINNNFTQAVGKNSTGWLQKVSKIPEGTYTHQNLAAKMSQVMTEYSNVDLLNWKIKFDTNTNPNGDYSIAMNTLYDENYDEKATNTFGQFESKMGYQEAAGNRDSGVGALSTAEVSFTEKNNITNPHVLINNNGNIPAVGTTWSNTTNPANLLSCMSIPTSHGVFQGGGCFAAVFQPLKQYTLIPAAFLSGVGSNKFDIYNGASVAYADSVLAAYSGSNGYDFVINDSGATTRLWVKFITGLTGGTSDKLDYYTLPNSAEKTNTPFAHIMIVNTSDQAIDTTLFSNKDVLLLQQVDKANITGWVNWKNGWDKYAVYGADATANAYIQSQLTLSNLEGAQWGSCAIGLNRGETSMVGTNQVHTGTDGNLSRTNIYNTTPKSASTLVNNKIQADYVLKVSPGKDGASSYYSQDYGEQQAGKVAGESGWQIMREATEDSGRLLTERMPSITSNDNLMLMIVMSNWQCVAMYLAHDTGGNMNFSVPIEVGNNNRTDPKPPSWSRNIHNQFNESSYPIMPFVASNGGFVSGGQQILVQGNYSQQQCSTKNLAKLYKKINDDWSLGVSPPNKAYTIPPRQEYATAYDICSAFTLNDRTFTISPDGFSGVSTDTSITIPEAQPDFGVPEGMDCCLRLGDFAEDSDYADVLTTNNDWTYQPSRLTALYKNLGMPKLLVNRDEEGVPTDEFVWNSTGDLEGNDSPNFIVNIDNMGRVQGQNSHTTSISQMVGVIPNAELEGETNERHFKSHYPLPVALNAQTEQNINNFNIYITRDDGKPAVGLQHPTNILLRIT